MPSTLGRSSEKGGLDSHQEDQEGTRRRDIPLDGAGVCERHRKVECTRGSMYHGKTWSVSLELVVLWRTATSCMSYRKMILVSVETVGWNRVRQERGPVDTGMDASQ